MSQLSPPAAPNDEVITDPRRRNLVLVGVCLALVAVVASVAGLNVGQAEIAVDLDASQGQVLWVINGYTLALAALLMPYGAIGDRWGRKPVLLAGLALFAAANLGSAFADSVEMLTILRVLAGVGAAAIMPATLSIITASFPSESRGTAVGVWAAFAGAGGMIGLFASSLLIDNATWPWLFVPPVVFAVLSAVMVLATVPNSKEHTSHRFDTVGSVLAVLMVGGLVLGIQEGPEKGWTDPLAITGLVVGALALVAFVLYELRRPGPLLDIRVFSSPMLSGGVLGLLVFFAAMFGVFLVLIQYLTIVAGMSAIAAAAGTLPMAGIMMPLSPVAPRLANRFGVRVMLATGLVVCAIALVSMGLLADQESYWAVLPGLMLLGAGLGLAMTPATTAITGALPVDKQGVASALNDSVREIGTAIGVALFGSMLSAGYRNNVSDAAASLDGHSAQRVEEGLASASQVAREIGGDAGTTLLDQAKTAFVDGWVQSMTVATALMLVGAVIVAVMMRGDTSSSGEDDEAADADEERRLVRV